LRYVLIIMADNLTDAVPQILIKIQDSISALRSELGTVRSEVGTVRSEVGQFRTSVEGRLDRLEHLNRKYRRDAAAMMVIMRATAGDFDERVNEVVERVAALEARTS
jgi:glycine cleavage system protein P-like pyridoxal-binding family